MQSAQEITIDSLRPKTLVMGPPYCGKTEFASTWPYGNIYYFDFDGNMSTLAGRARIYYDTFKDPDLKKPTGYMQALKTLETMAKCGIEKGYPALLDSTGNEIIFNHVVIDSASSLLDLCMNQVLFLAGRPGTVPRSSDWKDNDWTSQISYFQGFLRRALALPCAVTLNCHEHIDKSEVDIDKRVYPDITGKLATKIGSQFNLSLKMIVTVDPKTKEEHYEVLTKTQGMYYAGTRFKDALDVKEKADWVHLLKKIDAFIKTRKSEGEETK